MDKSYHSLIHFNFTVKTLIWNLELVAKANIPGSQIPMGIGRYSEDILKICSVFNNKDVSHAETLAAGIRLFSILYGNIMACC